MTNLKNERLLEHLRNMSNDELAVLITLINTQTTFVDGDPVRRLVEEYVNNEWNNSMFYVNVLTIMPYIAQVLGERLKIF